ncbi:MAG: GxxExxY protein [Candidatus Omnitrophica bacterium]|nr:GxxExxY protein [Candidatus Omnitrophota bacterium]
MAIDNKYLYSEITDKIIELAIKVHKTLGPGFIEKFYEKALIFEFSKNNVEYVIQKTINVKYGDLLLGIQRIDLVVENKVIVELKVVSEINDINVAQIVSYLKASGFKIGLVLNFAKNKLEIKRIIT